MSARLQPFVAYATKGCCISWAAFRAAFPTRLHRPVQFSLLPDWFLPDTRPMLTPLWAAVAVLVFAGASFFFAVAESALFSLGTWQTRQLAKRSPEAGGLVARLLAEPQNLLATIVLGNTF